MLIEFVVHCELLVLSVHLKSEFGSTQVTFYQSVCQSGCCVLEVFASIDWGFCSGTAVIPKESIIFIGQQGPNIRPYWDTLALESEPFKVTHIFITKEIYFTVLAKNSWQFRWQRKEVWRTTISYFLKGHWFYEYIFKMQSSLFLLSTRIFSILLYIISKLKKAKLKLISSLNFA